MDGALDSSDAGINVGDVFNAEAANVQLFVDCFLDLARLCGCRAVFSMHDHLVSLSCFGPW